MKGCIEAGYLRQFGMTLAERLDQFNLPRQMIRVIGPEPMQFVQQGLGDTLRCSMFHAVHHSVSDRFDGREALLAFQPVN